MKFRHLGYPGVASFQYNTHCGRFVAFEESKSPDIPNPDVKWDNSCWIMKNEERRMKNSLLFVSS